MLVMVFRVHNIHQSTIESTPTRLPIDGTVAARKRASTIPLLLKPSDPRVFIYNFLEGILRTWISSVQWLNQCLECLLAYYVYLNRRQASWVWLIHLWAEQWQTSRRGATRELRSLLIHSSNKGKIVVKRIAFAWVDHMFTSLLVWYYGGSGSGVVVSRCGAFCIRIRLKEKYLLTE